MADKDFIQQGKNVVQALGVFGEFVQSKLDEQVENAAPEDKEAVKAQVEKVKNGEFKEFNDKLNSVGVTLNNFK